MYNYLDVSIVWLPLNIKSNEKLKAMNATIELPKSTLTGTFVKWESGLEFAGSLYLTNEKTGKKYNGFLREDGIAFIYSNGNFYGRFKANVQ